MTSRKRELTEAERKLWEEAMRDAARLPVEKRNSRSGLQKPAIKKSGLAVQTIRANLERPAALERPVPQGQNVPNTRRQKRTHIRPDAALDLHGYTQERAHKALLRFFERARLEGHRSVLVITGTGARKEFVRYEPGERQSLENPKRGGLLKSLVPLWLETQAFQRLITAFGQAPPAYGGAAALIVRLRPS